MKGKDLVLEGSYFQTLSIPHVALIASSTPEVICDKGSVVHE